MSKSKTKRKLPEGWYWWDVVASVDTGGCKNEEDVPVGWAVLKPDAATNDWRLSLHLSALPKNLLADGAVELKLAKGRSEND